MSEVTSHLHPIIVHFPIAVILIAFLYDLFHAFRDRSLAAEKGAWLWTVAAIGCWLAVLTGPEDDARGNTNLLDAHSLLANLTSWAVTVLVLYRTAVWFKRRGPMLRGVLAGYLILAVLSLGLVLSTGYLGGKMVYSQGIGIKVDGNMVNPPKRFGQ